MIGGLCPEGTRNKKWREIPILPLKKGFVYALEEIKCDLVCMLYRDTDWMCPDDGDIYEGSIACFPFKIN